MATKIYKKIKIQSGTTFPDVGTAKIWLSHNGDGIYTLTGTLDNIAIVDARGTWAAK